MKYLSLFLSLLFLSLSACTTDTPAEQPTETPRATSVHAPLDPFADYWYQGKAELSSFDLQQSRYGELHEGEAVLIFVTEDFSKSKQVKLDYPSRAGKDKVGIMKLNFTRKFNTGIYPYSTMQSIFTPTDLKQYPHSLKVSTSSQEWCGHTYMQLNSEKDQWRVAHNSYFEAEGDRDFKLDKVMLEDEIWNRIRINPSSLPTGEIKAIPSTLFTRLKHTPFRVMNAQAKMGNAGKVGLYEIYYPELKRTLRIQFQKSFPHEILGWEEEDGRLTTKATRKQSMQLDYWNKNRSSDAPLRAELGLD
ncbi:MAG: hypothetical protein AAGG75_18525 [Bacteroidota bacterium]